MQPLRPLPCKSKKSRVLCVCWTSVCIVVDIVVVNLGLPTREHNQRSLLLLTWFRAEPNAGRIDFRLRVVDKLRSVLGQHVLYELIGAGADDGST